ncbi:FxSxx-COOH system tetratricopeptide repeat protein [Plantactinospora siamensis]|uniref:FxSxx-COOH system tetratricopeptide repeat protein n=1 Tax=Plantactinospora siamensis TaxID=555372 RepID=A0ABV6P3M2_9ACTN
MTEEPTRPDFFISYTQSDREWAEWIAVELERAGYTTVIQAWDIRPGTDFVHEMQRASMNARRTVAVLSPAYFASGFAEAEWRAAFVKDPTGERRLLLPVRVRECAPPGMLASLVYVDLTDVDETEARARLLAAAGPDPVRPTTSIFPGRSSAWFPGAGHTVTNLPARDRIFTGRDDVVRRIHDALHSVAGLSTVMVHGLGGVGKTAVAVEYAHRFAQNYDVIWWITADQPAAVASQLEKLAGRLGIARTDDGIVDPLLDHLRDRDRWLLIYDNVEDLDQLRKLLPAGGAGHLLLTSRQAAGAGRVSTLAMAAWSRTESVRFLIRRTGHTDATSLGELAELLGDLPLALDEAGAFLQETSEDLNDYLRLVREHGRRLFHLADAETDTDTVPDRRSVATVWTLSLQRVRSHAPAAVPLLTMLAFLAPEVPRGLLGERTDALPPALRSVVEDRVEYVRLLGVIGRYSLVTLTTDAVAMHRLVQAVVQARLPPADERWWAAAAVEFVRAAFPEESWEVRSWPECERLLPHLLTVTAHAERLGVCAATTGWLLDRASTYLRKRGQYRAAIPIAQRALTVTSTEAGAASSDTAWCHNNLGLALHALGDSDAARRQFEQALSISESTLGPGHPDVGIWRSNLGRVLRDSGDLTGARTQLELALRISERALGPDDPTIGVRRGTLARVLRMLGDLAGAKEQIEQGLRISEVALGPDHPSLGVRRSGLGAVLHEMGDLAGARAQFEEALRISAKALGPDHPRLAARHSGLGGVLRDLGDQAGARRHFEEAVRIGEAAYGVDDARVRAWRRSLGPVAQAPPYNDPLMAGRSDPVG